MKRIFLVFFTLIIINSPVLPQFKTNLEVAYQLISDSISKIDSVVVKKEKISNFSYTSPDSYNFLKSKVADNLLRAGYKFDGSGINTSLEFSIHKINVEYTDPYKDGFFGELMVKRNLSFEGIALLTGADGTVSVSLNDSFSDIVELDAIPEIEDQSIPFTKGTIPEIPLFSNILEPIIVVGTLIGTIILFFTVRSK